MNDITPEQQEQFTLARARAMLTVYKELWDTKWRSEFDILDVEREFSFSLLNPETESPSRTFCEAGKIDVLARRKSTGQLVVIEHKTTADDVDPASDYWDRLRMDTQCSKYFLAAFHMGNEVDGILYDVLKKPAQRPSMVPTLDDEGLKIVLNTGGERVFNKTGAPRQTADKELGYTIQGRIETPREFEDRLLLTMRSEPDKFFAHREVPRLNSDLMEYMHDAWNVGQQLLYHRARSLWPRNPQACKQFGTCEYFDICCGRASVDGIRFAERSRVHAELNIQQDGDRQLLTNSRITAFRKCPKFHWLKYEEKIERVDDEGKEALKFGTLIHEGLEKYFLSLKTQN